MNYEKEIELFMCESDIDFGYAVGNLNMDTTKESRENCKQKLTALLKKEYDRGVQEGARKPIVKYDGFTALSVKRLCEDRLEVLRDKMLSDAEGRLCDENCKHKSQTPSETSIPADKSHGIGGDK